MIELLKKIGFSDLEARCYLILHEEPKLSGYEVAKRLTVSRSNVYAALRSLTNKGACRALEEDPVLYNPVPIKQLTRHLLTEFEQTTETLVKELQAPPRLSPSFYNWQGENQVSTTIQRMIANAQDLIIVDIWSEDLHLFEDYLHIAEKKGVTVILISIGECNTSLQNVFVHLRNDEWSLTQPRKFSILCDSNSAFLGGVGGETKLSALETDHPAVIETLKSAFYHDLIMQHIEEDFEKELTEKYGKNYKKIMDYYKKDRGWNI